MLKLLLRPIMAILSSLKKADRTQGRQETHDEDIPYPLSDPGIPALSLENLLESQKDIIRKIEEAACLDFQDKYLVPQVIGSFAEFVHLVPASESHHHCLQGGLLRHSLEVALEALKQSRFVLFTGMETGERRYRLKSRWRFAVLIAALCHDLGKPCTDMAVESPEEKLRWNPFREPLFTWIERNKIKHYTATWKTERRHKEHEDYSAVILFKILSAEAHEYLTDWSDEILPDVINCIRGNPGKGHAKKLHDLVSEADGESVRDDMARRYGGRKVPIEEHIQSAMQQLVFEKWRVNVPGCPVWVSTEGVYVVWGPGTRDILDKLAKDGIRNVPREPVVLAELLIERGLAVRPTNSDGNPSQFCYSIIRPEIGTNRIHLTTLKLRDPGILFKNKHVPDPVEVTMRLPDQFSTSNAEGSVSPNRQRLQGTFVVKEKRRTAEEHLDLDDFLNCAADGSLDIPSLQIEHGRRFEFEQLAEECEKQVGIHRYQLNRELRKRRIAIPPPGSPRSANGPKMWVMAGKEYVVFRKADNCS